MIDFIFHAFVDYILNTPGAYVRYFLYNKKRSLDDLKKDYVLNSTLFILLVAFLVGMYFVILSEI